jgi:3-isopropylmalate/(R)-2-methylmalate dehydratase small subunit
MAHFTTLSSRVIPLPVNNIDTDQIIPARFLKVTDKAGLGQNLFADWRYLADGEPNPEFVINRPENQGAQILLAGDNFGCGSSREHAPWALMDFGFRAIISTSFADIFRNNSLKNGLLPVIVDAPTHQQLLSLAAEDEDLVLTIDVARQTLTLPDGRAVTFALDGFSKTCLLEGVDQLGYLLKQADRVEEFEAMRPSPINTALR